MKSGYAIFAIVIMLVASLTLGCTGSSGTSDQSTPTPQVSAGPSAAAATPTAAPTPTPAPTPVPSQTVSGTGNQASEKIHLDAGLAIFKSKNVDNSQYPMNFIVYLLDSDGKQVELVANDIGTSDSSSVEKITRSGDYLFDVTSTGSWTISVEQPRFTTAQSIPVKLTGSGDQVSETFYLKKGLVKFASKNVDNGKYSSNFIVYLIDSNGNSQELVANEIGTSDSSKATSVSKDGVYMLSVMSGGDWEISVSTS